MHQHNKCLKKGGTYQVISQSINRKHDRHGRIKRKRRPDLQIMSMDFLNQAVQQAPAYGIHSLFILQLLTG